MRGKYYNKNKIWREKKKKKRELYRAFFNRNKFHTFFCVDKVQSVRSKKGRERAESAPEALRNNNKKKTKVKNKEKDIPSCLFVIVG